MDDVETGPQELSAELDRLSLEQALIDFEVANARVRDLTQRLIAANHEIAELRLNLSAHQVELERIRTEHALMLQSRAWRLVSTISSFRKLLSGGR